MPEPSHLAFMQRGLVEVLVLSVACGLLGTWIVLRGLAFFAHAAGTATFPGLVLADGLGFAPALGGFGAAAAFALCVSALATNRRSGQDSRTALALVGFLALGVILASDVFRSGSNVETLLFGSLLVIQWSDIALAAAAAVLVLGATALLGRRWLAIGFDPDATGALGLRSRLPHLVLLGLVALASIAALSAVGALPATALLVVPAATARLLVTRLRPWQLASIGLAAVEGVLGLWLAYRTNAPPGATIAVLAGAGFVLALGLRALRRLGVRRPLVVGGACLLLAAPLAAGCGDDAGESGGTGPEPERISVVASTTQIADWVREVGGDRVEVHQILQPNTDPHDYETRPRDVEEVAEAAVVFVSGGDLDEWMSEVVEQSGGEPTVVDLGADRPVKLAGEEEPGHEEEEPGHEEEEPGHEEEAGGIDPHWWHDPTNVVAAVATIRDALVAADPAVGEVVGERAGAYSARLEDLDSAIVDCFAAVPPGERKLVTDHEAFSYFANRYEIRVIGTVIPSQTTQAQPSAGDVARLSELIRREGVRAVFPESSLNPGLATQIARQTGASADYTLYGDTLGPQDSDGATYIRMEAANADAMVRGFTGGAERCEIPGVE